MGVNAKFVIGLMVATCLVALNMSAPGQRQIVNSFEDAIASQQELGSILGDIMSGIITSMVSMLCAIGSLTACTSLGTVVINATITTICEDSIKTACTTIATAIAAHYTGDV